MAESEASVCFRRNTHSQHRTWSGHSWSRKSNHGSYQHIYKCLGYSILNSTRWGVPDVSPGSLNTFLSSVFQSRLQRASVLHGLISETLGTNKTAPLRMNSDFQIGQPKCRGEFFNSAWTWFCSKYTQFKLLKKIHNISDRSICFNGWSSFTATETRKLTYLYD